MIAALRLRFWKWLNEPAQYVFGLKASPGSAAYREARAMSALAKRWHQRFEEFVRDEECNRIREIVEAHADMAEFGNRSLVDLILDEIGGGSETRLIKGHTHTAALAKGPRVGVSTTPPRYGPEELS